MNLEVKTWYWISDLNEGDLFEAAYVDADGRIIIDDARYERRQLEGVTFTKAVMPDAKELIVYAAGIKIGGTYAEFIFSPDEKKVEEYLEIMRESTPEYAEAIFSTNHYQLVSSTTHNRGRGAQGEKNGIK
jgi:hypothetical protein